MRKPINEENNISDSIESTSATQSHGVINIEYKDRLFKAIFGKPENKEWTLSLYNAVNGSHYKNADDIEFTTIDDVLYIKMKNDVSFLVDNIMNLYEQQSTYNPNMPMRYFISGPRSISWWPQRLRRLSPPPSPSAVRALSSRPWRGSLSCRC